jgi:FixJ family two-component response regulator
VLALVADLLRSDPRETQVLRLVADGFDTGEIALRMCYSERTVKNVADLTTWLQLRTGRTPSLTPYAKA